MQSHRSRQRRAESVGRGRQRQENGNGNGKRTAEDEDENEDEDDNGNGNGNGKRTDEDENEDEDDNGNGERVATAREQPRRMIGWVRKMTQFDHEKLDVYRLLLEFVAWVTDVLAEVRQNSPGPTTEVRGQLDRASLSALLNTAEGNGKRRRRIRAKFFDDARGSATECAACLDALVVTRCCTAERVQEGKAMLLRVVSMLTKLVDLWENAPDDARRDDGKQD